MIIEYHDIEPLTILGSQKGQDIFIKHTFDCIGTTNKYYVDFGAIDGWYCSNVSFLREYSGWSGLLLEGNEAIPENPEINLHIRRITKENICELFEEFNVPEEFDFLCVDIDGMDYWILREILKKYRPRAVMVETNVRFEPDQSFSLKYNPNWSWDGSRWYGASPLAFKKMLNGFGYSVVWICTDDMIAIRKDVLEAAGHEEPDWSYVYPSSNVSLYDSHISGGYFMDKMDENEWQEV